MKPFFVACLLAFLALSCPWPVTAAQEACPLQALNDSLVEVFERVAPSVVVIEVEKRDVGDEDEESPPFPFDFFFREPQAPRGGPPDRRFRLPAPPSKAEGSGFIVRSDGYIYTNSHVINGGEKVRVKLRDGREFPAHVVGTDDKTDIAVLKIEAENLPVAELGDSDAAKVGQIVCAIGTPYNLDYTFTLGVISAKGRSNLQQAVYEEYIQTDASINPGNSGGPLFDIHGRVLGMNTLINGINRGLGFAIPASMLREVGEALIRDGKVTRPWLGIRIETLADRDELREHFKGIDRGVVVQTIEPGTPAYGSELRPADVIVRIDGVPVSTARELQKQVLSKRVGQKVTLEVWRGGQTRSITLTTGRLPDDTELARSGADGNAPEREQDPATGPLASWGLQVQALTPELARRLDLPEDRRGVLVTDVGESGSAAVAGLMPRDVVTEVNNQPVTDPEAFTKALERSDPDKGALLLIDRGGNRTYAVLKRPR